MNDKIDKLIKYYEDLIAMYEADMSNTPAYLVKHELMKSEICMAEEFISDLKGLKKEI